MELALCVFNLCVCVHVRQLVGSAVYLFAAIPHESAELKAPTLNGGLLSKYYALLQRSIMGPALILLLNYISEHHYVVLMYRTDKGMELNRSSWR